jgi:hypothetical protein
VSRRQDDGTSMAMAIVVACALALVALLLGGHLLGCAPPAPAAPPAPLLPLVERANALAPRVQAHGKTMESDARTTLRADLEACPLEPTERLVCATLATERARRQHLAAEARALAIEARHRDARTALTAAAACRTAGNEACATAERAEAERALVEVEAALDTPTAPETTP